MTHPQTKNRAPLFRQIVDHLRSDIIDGNLPEHAPLPSERAVAETHNVSRMTARRALEALEAEGLAYSEDRKGRFVSPPRLQYKISSMANFIADAKSDGVDLEIEILDRSLLKADHKLSVALSLPLGTELHRYTRRFSNRGHATFLETEYFLPTRFPTPFVIDINQPAERELEHRLSPLGHTSDAEFRIYAIPAKDAAFLGVAAHQPGLLLEQITRDRSGTPVCFSHQVWRGELAQFSARAIVNQ